MVKSTITAKIDALLAQKGISKSDFYKECNITSVSYSQWNTGKTSPKMKNLYKIAEFLDVPLEYLLSENEQKKEASPQYMSETSEKLLNLINRLSTEQQLREIAYLQSLLNDQDK